MSDRKPQDAPEQNPSQPATSPAASSEASSETSFETPSKASPQNDGRNAPLGGLLVAVGALLLFINLSGIGLGGLITRLWPLLIVYAGYR
ncbi:MAG: hypothetical protein U5L04_00225, partial [Trueperaceae bacterium]|nr:hypothetical protein [Trueperaceae bacterium]